nr:immunoglobulin heavy chain junction region [Mus musculus]
CARSGPTGTWFAYW